MSDSRSKHTVRDAKRGDRTPSGTATDKRPEAELPHSPPAHAMQPPPAMPYAAASDAADAPPPEVVPTPVEILVEPVPSAARPVPEAGAARPDVATAQRDETWDALVEAQAAFARGFEEIAGEVTGMTRSGFTATTDAAIALLGARTFAEVVEINAALARHGVDAMIESSAKLSEIGVKAMTQASRPLLSRLADAWRGPHPA